MNIGLDVTSTFSTCFIFTEVPTLPQVTPRLPRQVCKYLHHIQFAVLIFKYIIAAPSRRPAVVTSATSWTTTLGLVVHAAADGIAMGAASATHQVSFFLQESRSFICFDPHSQFDKFLDRHRANCIFGDHAAQGSGCFRPRHFLDARRFGEDSYKETFGSRGIFLKHQQFQYSKASQFFR